MDKHDLTVQKTWDGVEHGHSDGRTSLNSGHYADFDNPIFRPSKLYGGRRVETDVTTPLLL